MKLTTRTVRIVSLTFRKSTDTCPVVSIFMISSLLFFPERQEGESDKEPYCP